MAKIDNDASGDEDSDRESGRLMIDEGSSPMGNSPKKKKKKTPRSAKAKSVGKDSVPSVIVTKERAVPKVGCSTCQVLFLACSFVSL